jgi:hypothetical protein
MGAPRRLKARCWVSVGVLILSKVRSPMVMVLRVRVRVPGAVRPRRPHRRPRPGAQAGAGRGLRRLPRRLRRRLRGRLAHPRPTGGRPGGARALRRAAPRPGPRLPTRTALGAPLRRQRTGRHPPGRRPQHQTAALRQAEADAAAAAGDETERTPACARGRRRRRTGPDPRRPHRRVAGARRRPRTVPRAHRDDPGQGRALAGDARRTTHRQRRPRARGHGGGVAGRAPGQRYRRAGAACPTVAVDRCRRPPVRAGAPPSAAPSRWA